MTNHSLKILRFYICVTFVSVTSFAQSFSFNCTRDTIITGCSTNGCVTLQYIIPDIHVNTGSYTVNPIPTYGNTCFPIYTPWGTGGTSANFTQDDVYTPFLNIGFPFHFYGGIFNRLMISPNGGVCLDPAGIPTGFAQFGILNYQGSLNPDIGTGENFPSQLHDRALIMGPYHDLNPALPTSPTMRIQYNVVGVAPHRKWIVSFYKVPMYTRPGYGCDLLFQNSHQIVLYESTGIVEVLIADKQICPSWNQGRAMVGMQNLARDAGIMAPGRRATDNPWGSIGMNETWRFVPSGGNQLFKRVSLFDLAGTLVSTGVVTNLNNGLLSVSFPNVCTPTGTTTYIARSVYAKIDDPNTEIFGNDTIRVTRNSGGGLNATALPAPAGCGLSTGSVTITVPPGMGVPPFQYNVNGGPFQASNIFTGLPPGNHTAIARDAAGCSSTIPFTITQNNVLNVNPAFNPTSCSGVNDGSITITPVNGSAPYTYSLNGGPVQASNTFTNLAPGTYTITTRDASGCSVNSTVIIVAGTGLLFSSNATATSCTGGSDGTITVTTQNGTGPYTYTLNNGTPQTSNVFSNVAAGIHTVTVTDSRGCSATQQDTILAGAPMTLTTSSNPSGCNNDGTITVNATSSTGPYTFILDGNITQTGATNTTFTNVAPGNHSIVVTSAAGCTSAPQTVTVQSNGTVSATVTSTDAGCNGSSTGSITVINVTGDTAPYQYSLNGSTWQAGNVFNGLAAGTYNVYYRGSNGCQNFQPNVVVGQSSAITAITGINPVSCNGQNDGSIVVTPSGGSAPYQYSIDNGTTWQSSATFNSLAIGSYTIQVKDNSSCITTLTPAIVSEPSAVRATVSTVNADCRGGNSGRIIVNANGGRGGYQYSLGNEIWQSHNSFNVAAGDYFVIVKDISGCSFTVSNVRVSVTNNLSVALAASNTICEGTSVQLNTLSNADQFSWTPATGLSNPNIANPVANPTSTTTYTLTGRLGSCSTSVTTTVNVNRAPVPEAGPNDSICKHQPYQLNGSGGVRYEWTPSTGLSNPNIANPTLNIDRNMTYTLSVIDANNCRSLRTDQVNIYIKPPFRVYTNPVDTIVPENDQFNLQAWSIGTAYSWTPAIGLSNPNIANPVLTVTTDNLYKVTATTPEGCTGESYVRIQVYKGPELYVPTGFTPNNDGKNDLFKPFAVGIKELKHFRVFNRWGQIVFATTRLGDGWNGKFNGVDQPIGVYIWMVEGVTRDGRVISKKGSVTLIR